MKSTYEIHEILRDELEGYGLPTPDSILIPEGKEVPSGRYTQEDGVWLRSGPFPEGTLNMIRTTFPL